MPKVSTCLARLNCGVGSIRVQLHQHFQGHDEFEKFSVQHLSMSKMAYFILYSLLYTGSHFSSRAVKSNAPTPLKLVFLMSLSHDSPTRFYVSAVTSSYSGSGTDRTRRPMCCRIRSHNALALQSKLSKTLLGRGVS